MVYECEFRLRRKVEVWWSKSREEPWRAQAASTRQSRSNPNFRGNRVDTIFRAGLPALLFFLEQRFPARSFFRDNFQKSATAFDSRHWHDGTGQPHTPKF